MTTTARSLSDQAALLPPEERLALVELLLDTLDVPDQALDALWATEASSRLAAFHCGEVRAVALSDVIAKWLPATQRDGCRAGPSTWRVA